MALYTFITNSLHVEHLQRLHFQFSFCSIFYNPKLHNLLYNSPLIWILVYAPKSIVSSWLQLFTFVNFQMLLLLFIPFVSIQNVSHYDISNKEYQIFPTVSFDPYLMVFAAFLWSKRMVLEELVVAKWLRMTTNAMYIRLQFWNRVVENVERVVVWIYRYYKW